MSARPNEAKKRRRVAKAVRRQPPPRFINLIHFLKDRRYARTTGEAHRLILAGKVKVDSHVLGIQTRPQLQPDGSVKDVDIVAPMVKAEFRSRIVVLP